jgi:hypothetical protein
MRESRKSLAGRPGRPPGSNFVTVPTEIEETGASSLNYIIVVIFYLVYACSHLLRQQNLSCEFSSNASPCMTRLIRNIHSQLYILGIRFFII